MASNVLTQLLSRLNGYEKELEATYAAYRTEPADEDDACRVWSDTYKRVLEQLCNVCREGADGGLSDQELSVLVEKAGKLEQRTVMYATAHGYGGILVSCGNIIKDASMGKLPGIGNGAMKDFTELLMLVATEDKKKDVKHILAETMGSSVKPYDPVHKPSTLSTPLARFCDQLPTLSSTTLPSVRAFVEARCEIESDDICSPINMTKCGSILALQGCAGWKLRDPSLHLMRMDGDGMGSSYVDVGLSDVANAIVMDGERQLVYVGDSDRVKSYSWSIEEDGELFVGIPVHTLDSHRYSGPMLLKDNGRQILRAGSIGIAVWNTENLPTHGEDGDRIIGKKMKRDNLNSWRDNDNDEIERSTGTAPAQKLDATPLMNICAWTERPSHQSSTYVAYGVLPRVAQVNIETQQQINAYVGHTCGPTRIAVHASEPNTFVTASPDGAARFYDVRIPAPVLTVKHNDEDLGDAIYEYIGGQPFLIMGATRSQQVKVWDMRARQALYKLSTGNNSVEALVWDEPRQTLYAMTECTYMDRMGNHMDYRAARFPKTGGEEDDAMDDAEEDEEDDEYYEDEYDRCWPSGAYHKEDAFGYPFDSGENRLIRYRFKPEPNVDILPVYGNATIDSGYSW